MPRCGLLGRTLAHSYSPAIHKALGGGYSYELFEIKPDALASFLEQSDFHGLNVTIPYKQAVIPFCQSLSPTAAAIGSVNTLLRQPDGSLHGHNTDAAGFLAMLRQSGIRVAGKQVLVLGSGGSSLTVCHVLREQRVAKITVISRKGEHTYESLPRHSGAQILINTTPVGMYPATGESLVNLAFFPHLEGVLDLIYNPARTRFLMDAKMRNIPHMGGLPMLVGQAAAAAELFSGRPIDTEQVNRTLYQLRRQMENIVLIGMPGSGKSTIGHLLHKCTGRPLIDTDRKIEQEAKMPIPEIFQREGEAAFRARETEVLEEWGKESGLIISTGGGVVTREENYRHLHQNGMIFFLERPLSKLERTGRPLSRGDIAKMYERRHPQYQRFADYTVQNNEGEPDMVADTILELFMGKFQ